MNPLDVLVIGAGLSGLTTAQRLVRAGFNVQVVEATARAGGVIGTDTRDGFMHECGPNSMLDASPDVRELLSTLSLADQRRDVNRAARKRFVVRDGRVIALPTSPSRLLATPLFSMRAKLRLMKEPFTGSRSGADESVSAFVTRRFGREFLDYAVEPFVAGIYAGNPDELAVEAAFPRLHMFERVYRSVIKGALRSSKERAKERGAQRMPKSFSFVNGMQTLTDGLATAAGGIRFNARADRISQDGNGFVIDIEENGGRVSVTTRTVIVAVPAKQAAALLRPLAASAADALDGIPYAAIASVALGYERKDVSHPLDGFGFLVPRVENRRILGCLFSSSLFERRAPENHVLLTTFIGGRRNPALAALSNEELARIAHEELAASIGARAVPQFTAVTRWPSAIPQYTIGHLERIAQAGTVEKALPGLFLCGSYRRGVSIGDCISSGFKVADEATSFLRRGQAPLT